MRNIDFYSFNQKRLSNSRIKSILVTGFNNYFDGLSQRLHVIIIRFGIALDSIIHLKTEIHREKKE